MRESEAAEEEEEEEEGGDGEGKNHFNLFSFLFPNQFEVLFFSF